MRRFKFLYFVFILLSLSLCMFSCRGKKPAEGDKPKRAEIQLDSDYTWMGTFPKSIKRKSTVFTFTNVGTAPLEFLDVDYSCGCISATYPKKPVKPGKKGEIKVTFNTDYKDPGKFYYKVYFAVTGWPENFVLRLKGDMTEN